MLFFPPQENQITFPFHSQPSSPHPFLSFRNAILSWVRLEVDLGQEGLQLID